MQALIVAHDDFVRQRAVLAVADVVNADLPGLVDELESHGQRRQNQNPLVGLLHDVPGNRQLHQGFAKASITEQSHAPLAHGLGDDGLLEVKRTFRHPHRVESELSGAVLLVDMNVS